MSNALSTSLHAHGGAEAIKNVINVITRANNYMSNGITMVSELNNEEMNALLNYFKKNKNFEINKDCPVFDVLGCNEGYQILDFWNNNNEKRNNNTGGETSNREWEWDISRPIPQQIPNGTAYNRLLQKKLDSTLTDNNDGVNNNFNVVRVGPPRNDTGVGFISYTQQ